MSLLTRLFSEPWLISREYLPAFLRTLEVRSVLAESRAAVIYSNPSEPCCDGSDIIRIGSTGVIQVSGPILKNPDREEMDMGACDIDQVRFLADVAAADPTIERVILKVSSPGGIYTGLPECSDVLGYLARTKPLLGFTDSQAFSAAYWLLSQAEEIYVTPSARVGSIGVYSLYQDASKMLESLGLKTNAFSVGKFKLAGQPWKEMTDDERAYFQEAIERIGLEFKDAVNTRRIIAPEAMEGQTFDALTAIQNNLADSMVNSFEELIGLLATA